MQTESAAGEEMNSEQFDDEYDIDRTMRLKSAIKKAFEKNAELLERLGSDYDENGIPYWEKNERT